MNKKFAYVFTIGNSLQWSQDTEEMALNRPSTASDIDMTKDFIERGKVGSFIKLSTGEMMFRTE